MSFIQVILDLLFPKQCYSCSRLGSYICNNCRSKIESIKNQYCPYCRQASHLGLTHPGCRRENGIDGLFSFFRYVPLTQRIIKQIKYRLVKSAIEELISVIEIEKINQLSELIRLSKRPIFIPVPLHPSRFARRGFNQAEEFALSLSQISNVPVNINLVSRIKKTKPQAQLSRLARYRNINGAFKVMGDKSVLTNHDLFLIDDVWSSGSTLKELSRILKRAGAMHVYAISITR